MAPNRSTTRRAPASLLLALATTQLGCQAEAHLRIGFVGPLSGRMSELGVPARDAAQLAVEDAEAGGLGRRVELLIADDAHDPETAMRAVEGLLEARVTAVVGHMTSAMSQRTVPRFDEARVVLLSPTTSTDELRGKKDFFFRVYPSSADPYGHLAQHVIERWGTSRVAIALDVSNRAHSESAARAFRGELLARGGTVAAEISFESDPTLFFSPIAARILESSPEALFVLANGRDTAMLCQQLRKAGARLPVVVSEWSVSPALTQLGGAAVDGLFFLHSIDPTDTSERFTRFSRTYRARFGAEPDFAAIHAYDATRILLEAASHVRRPEDLPQVLLRPEGFEGLQTTIRFDEYGDVVRAHFPMRVHRGDLVLAEEAR